MPASEPTLSYVGSWTNVHATRETPGMRAKRRRPMVVPARPSPTGGESSREASSDDRLGRARGGIPPAVPREP